MKIFFVLILYTSIISSFGQYDINLRCPSTGFQCVNQTTFIVCVDIGNETLVPTPWTNNCPDKYVCDDKQRVPCIHQEKTTTVSTTTSTTEYTTAENEISTTTTTRTPPPVKPFVCKEPGLFPTENCIQYYECTRILFWFRLRVRTCPNGYWFTNTSKTCVNPKHSDCHLETHNIV